MVGDMTELAPTLWRGSFVGGIFIPCDVGYYVLYAFRHSGCEGVRPFGEIVSDKLVERRFGRPDGEGGGVAPY